MFGGDGESSFVQDGRNDNMTRNNNGPVVSNGLFSGNALKEDEPAFDSKQNRNKLNSIFDYEDSDEE